MKRSKRDSLVKHAFISVSVTLFLLLTLEIGSFALLHAYRLRYAGDVDFGGDNDYLNAARRLYETHVQSQYCPYLENCVRPFNASGAFGSYSVRSIGERTTVNACDDGESPTEIFVFGGSTTLGLEVFDNDTWPSRLSAELCRRGIRNRVRNFGDSGYTSTQELVKLELLLREGARPGIVIFYDGVNDYYAAYQGGVAGAPQNTFVRSLSFQLFSSDNLFNPFYVSSTAKLLRYLGRDRALDYAAAEVSAIGSRVRGIYANNTVVVGSLAEAYRFTPIFIWQPIVFTKDPLTGREQGYAQSAFGDFVDGGGYTLIAQDVSAAHFYDFRDLFDARNDTLFLDAMHVGRTGNAIIAAAVAERIVPSLSVD